VSDKQEVVAVPLEPSRQNEPPAYKVCWVHFRKKVGGDIYVGIIVEIRMNSIMSIRLYPLAHVQRRSSSKWRVIAQMSERVLNFTGCSKVEERNGDVTVVFKSDTGETITLTNDPDEIRKAQSLLNPP